MLNQQALTSTLTVRFEVAARIMRYQGIASKQVAATTQDKDGFRYMLENGELYCYLPAHDGREMSYRVSSSEEQDILSSSESALIIQERKSSFRVVKK